MRLNFKTLHGALHHANLNSLMGIGLLALCVGAASCANKKDGATQTNETAANLVVLNASTGGIVRRVFVGEGVTVREGAPIIEIELATEGAGTANANDDVDEARRRAAASQTIVRTDEREVERALIEVQRVESLVAQNAAPQAQLDAARAIYQAAQERLQQTQRGGQSVAPKNYGQTPNSPSTQLENRTQSATQLVRATRAGNVRVISVRVGQRVIAGQPVATMNAALR